MDVTQGVLRVGVAMCHGAYHVDREYAMHISEKRIEDFEDCKQCTRVAMFHVKVNKTLGSDVCLQDKDERNF